MGMPLFSRSHYDKPYQFKKMEVYTDLEKVKGNPDPFKFKILRYLPVMTFMVVLVEYPGTLNYEGKKILVFEDLSWDELRMFSSLDPHFSDNEKFKSPVARFEPTSKGWNMAMASCVAMQEVKDIGRVHGQDIFHNGWDKW